MQGGIKQLKNVSLPIAQSGGAGESNLCVPECDHMEHGDVTGAVHLTSVTVHVPVNSGITGGSESRSAKKSGGDPCDGEQEVISKRVALQELDMQPHFGGDNARRCADGAAANVDGDMGE